MNPQLVALVCGLVNSVVRSLDDFAIDCLDRVNVILNNLQAGDLACASGLLPEPNLAVLAFLLDDAGRPVQLKIIGCELRLLAGLDIKTVERGEEREDLVQAFGVVLL